MAGYSKIASNGCHFLNGLINKSAMTTGNKLTKAMPNPYTKRNRPTSFSKKGSY